MPSPGTVSSQVRVVVAFGFAAELACEVVSAHFRHFAWAPSTGSATDAVNRGGFPHALRIARVRCG